MARAGCGGGLGFNRIDLRVLNRKLACDGSDAEYRMRPSAGGPAASSGDTGVSESSFDQGAGSEARALVSDAMPRPSSEG